MKTKLPNLRAAINGRAVIDLNQPLRHPERQKRLEELDIVERKLRNERLRRRTIDLNLGELEPGDREQNIDDKIQEATGWVKTLAAEAMLMAHTLAALKNDVGEEEATTNALWQCVSELPIHIGAAANAALGSVRTIEATLRNAGLLLNADGEPASLSDRKSV